MGTYKFNKTELNDVILVQPTVYSDSRGFFMETYSKKEFAKNGITNEFVEENQSYNKDAGVLRGLHFQNGEFAQAKLVRCIRGAVVDVIVDLRKESSTYLKYQAFELTEENKNFLMIPRGFAHGYITLKPDTAFAYMVDNIYAPAESGGINAFDKELDIDWSQYYDGKITMSDKDRDAESLSTFISKHAV